MKNTIWLADIDSFWFERGYIIERHLVSLKTIHRKLNDPELGYNIVGAIVAFACGGVQPLFAIMFSEILGKLLNFWDIITRSHSLVLLASFGSL